MASLTRSNLCSHATVLLVICAGGCTLLNPDRYSITRDGFATLLIQDSAEVQRMLSEQSRRDAAVEQFWKEKHSTEEGTERMKDTIINPTRYTPGRKEFLSAMSQQPGGMSIPEKTYVRVLRDSGARCNLNPIVTTNFILVRITSGPFAGHEGWACQDDIAGTVAMP